MVVPRPSSARPSTAASRPIYGAPAPSSGLSLYDQRPKSPEVGRPRRSAAYPAASAPRPTFGAADRGGSGSSAAWNAGTAAKPRSPVRGPPPRATPSSWGENGHSSNNGTYGRDYRNNGYRRPTPPRSKAPPASSFGGGDQRKAPTPPRSKAQPSARHQWRPEPQEKPAYRDEEDDHHYNGNYGRYGEPEEDPAPQEEAEDFGADGDRREDEADVDAEGDFAYWDQAGAAFEDQDGMMNGEEAGAEGADDNFDDFEHFPQEEAPPEEDAYDEGEFDRAPEEEMGCEDEHWGEEQAEPVEGEDEVVAEDGIWADEEQDGKYDGLDSVPDHMRESAEAVEGNLALKRALSADTPGDNPAAKRRKLEDGSPKTDMQAIRTLLAGWRLEACRASKYVLQLATPSELKVLQRNRFKPNPNHRRTICEQIHDEVLRTRERESMPASSTVDAVDAFMQRWKNNVTSRDQDGRALRALSHRDLRSLLHEYDGSVPLSKQLDSLEELPPAPAEEDGSGTAAQEKPGCFTLGRSNRLELMDPFADALVVGDANLTFSLQLAAHRKALHHSGKVYATTFEKIETLRERYPEIDTTVKKLQDYGAEVIHDVDCTRLVTYSWLRGMEGRFGSVYYNFPHAGVVTGFFDGHPFVRWRHANLMHLFFRALRNFVKEGGSVKVSSNSRATGVRFSDIIGAARDNEFNHVETVPFLEWQLSNYRRSYGDRRDTRKRPEDGEVYNDQKANSDMVYCFRYAPKAETLPAPAVIYPPTKLDLFLSSEGNLGKRATVARKKRVEELYQLFMSYVEGIHVG